MTKLMLKININCTVTPWTMKWCFSSYCSLKCQEKKRLIISFNVICLLWTYIVKELLATDKYLHAVLPRQDQKRCE